MYLPHNCEIDGQIKRTFAYWHTRPWRRCKGKFKVSFSFCLSSRQIRLHVLIIPISYISVWNNGTVNKVRPTTTNLGKFLDFGSKLILERQDLNKWQSALLGSGPIWGVFSSVPFPPTFGQILPNSAKFCWFLLNSDYFGQIQPNSAKFSHLLPNSADFCQILPNSVKFCQFLTNLAKFGQPLHRSLTPLEPLHCTLP